MRRIGTFTVVLALLAGYASSARAGDWDAAYTKACEGIPDSPSREIYPAVQHVICACAFRSVSYSPLWGSVEPVDLQKGLAILERRVETSTPIRVVYPPAQPPPPFRNQKFGEAIAALTLLGVDTLTGSSSVASCYETVSASEKSLQANPPDVMP